ncbi:MAG: hypothetical protein RR273_06220, partial [Oscillospiraceae bacterium]
EKELEKALKENEHLYVPRETVIKPKENKDKGIKTGAGYTPAPPVAPVKVDVPAKETVKNPILENSLKGYQKVVSRLSDSPVEKHFEKDLGSIRYAGEQFGQGVKSVGAGVYNAILGDSLKHNNTALKASQGEGIAGAIGKFMGIERSPEGEEKLKAANDRLKNKIVENHQSTQQKTQQLEEKYQDLPQGEKTVGKLVGQVTGQVAPLVAVGALSPLTAKQMLYGMVSGNAMSEAIASGADTDTAYKYGITEGIKELAVESLVGGIPNLGGGVLDPDKIVKEYIKSPAGQGLAKWGIDTIGEGFEEVVSDILSPYIKRYYYDPKAPAPTIEELSMSFAGGAIGGGVFGAPAALSNIAQGSKGDTATQVNIDNGVVGDNKVIEVKEGLPPAGAREDVIVVDDKGGFESDLEKNAIIVDDSVLFDKKVGKIENGSS